MWTWRIDRLERVVKNGFFFRIELLLILRTRGCPMDDLIAEVAAEGGYADLLIWLRDDNACALEESTLDGAARGGHLDILQLLRSGGCPWDAMTCAAAAAGGQLQALCWLHENGCPWMASTCTSAADNGHLEVLDWARGNGCSWSVATCEAAAGGGTWRPSNGFARTDARRMAELSPPLLPKNTATSLSGRRRAGVSHLCDDDDTVVRGGSLNTGG